VWNTSIPQSRACSPPRRFRTVVLHEYGALDRDRVVDALQHLDPIARFARIVADLADEGSRQA
jgi:uncharacterized protein YutE (UPF0331/DUF86 family)